MRILLSDTLESYIEEILGNLDFSSLDVFLNEHMRTKINLEELIARISVDGIGAINGESLSMMVFDTFLYELSVARPIFLKMLLFSVLFSVFQRVLTTKNKYISNMGFLLIYGTMMILLMQSFFLVKDISLDGINALTTFLNALIPTYAGILVFSGNAVSGAFFYEIAFGVIYLLEYVIRVFMIPIIHIFVLVLFMNQLFDEDKLSKLADLMEKAVKIMLKAAFGGVIGMGVIQSLLTPAKDRVTGNMILQGMSAIPGVGNTLGSAGEIILSCGMLIKNSVGVVALVILVFVAVGPVIKIGCFWVMYHLLSAVLQPIADKRVTECVSAVARGCDLYLKIIIYSMLLFFILIAMVGAATSFIH